MQIRDTAEADLPQIRQVHRAAFGGDTEAALVETMLADASARPLLSLLAAENKSALGHVLFSSAGFAGADGGAALAILAPLAVIPGAQGQGIGRRLVETGLQRLGENGADLVFVLGDPRYYARFGFVPAAPQGLLAPYALPPEYAEAWRVRRLGGSRAALTGTVVCCESLMRPELWTE